MTRTVSQKLTIPQGVFWKTFIILMLLSMAIILIGMFRKKTEDVVTIEEEIMLPQPDIEGHVSVEQALLKRRSHREFSESSLTLREVAQLLWAAQGVTSDDGKRTAPSAGALYPLELYVVSGKVTDLAPGVYKYLPAKHTLMKTLEGDKRNALSSTALFQSSIRHGAIVLVFTAVYERITGRYGNRGRGYVHMEAGHAAQNVYLQATALGIGTVVVGAFQDDLAANVLDLPNEEHPLYFMPAGGKVE